LRVAGENREKSTENSMALDTHPDAERVQIDLMRTTPVWRKMDLLAQLNQAARLFAISGLRRRYPGATEQEIHRRLADLVLGAELAERVYGPLFPEEEPTDAQ
jgi:hypothetical protein